MHYQRERVFVLVADRPADVALGAFASLAAHVHVIVIDPKNVDKGEHVVTEIERRASPLPAVVVPVNTVWGKSATSAIRSWTSINAVDLDLSCATPRPAGVLAERIADRQNENTLPTYMFYRRNHQEMLDIIDDHISSANREATDPVFSAMGLWKAGEDLSFFTKFRIMFRGLDPSLTVGKLRDLWTQHSAAAERIAEQRARTGSKLFQMNTHGTAAVAEAPDLVEPTHRALRKLHEGCDFTVCVSRNISTNALHYSIRGYGGREARDLASLIGGTWDADSAVAKVRCAPEFFAFLVSYMNINNGDE